MTISRKNDRFLAESLSYGDNSYKLEIEIAAGRHSAESTG